MKKLLIWAVLSVLALQGCGMVQGLASDVGWLARASQEALKNIE